MRRLAITLLASSALAGLGQTASAADLPVKARAPAPVSMAAYNWSGFYIGAHLGTGWARKQWTDPNPECFEDSIFDGFNACTPSNLGSHNAVGVLGGGQAGFNWQSGYLVFGIEAQYSFANLKGDHENTFTASASVNDGFVTFNQSERFSTKIKGIATIAGRIGLASWPNDRTLFYVKGGAAYVKEEFTQSLNATFFGCTQGCGSLSFGGELSASQPRWGWMGGIGLEYGLFDNWSGKVEYNYLDFGKKTVRLEGIGCLEEECAPISRDREIRQEIHLIKFGLNYRFGDFGKGPVGKGPVGKGPVVTRY